MSENLKEQILSLASLQQVYSQIEAVQSELSQVDAQLAAMDQELLAFEGLIDSESGQIAQLRKCYRDAEREVQDNQVLISKNKGKLRVVKTNQEYQALLKEIEGLEAKNSKIEDTMLMDLERIEGVEQALAQRRAELVARREAVADQKKLIDTKTTEKKARLDELESQKGAITSAISSPLLDKFNLVRTKVGTLVVAPVVSAVCQGCNMNVPPQLYNELQRFDSLRFCPQCQRIIYWKQARSE
jgi:hypothetical protein